MPTIPHKLASLLVLAALAACGGENKPANAPGAPEPATAPPPKAAEPETKSTPETTAPVAPSAPAPEATAEKCDGGWICVKVAFDTKKVEPRETKVLGDPKIETTWSKNSDGRPATFDQFSKGAVELTLRRKPQNKNEVVVKIGKGPEVVIDRKDGSVDDFTYVSAIAAEDKGALLIDLRYMK
jgi:hypothetical protein